MFDSPLEWCTVCKDWVALDQTVLECARCRGCPGRACPLAALLCAPQKRQQDEAALRRRLPLR